MNGYFIFWIVLTRDDILYQEINRLLKWPENHLFYHLNSLQQFIQDSRGAGSRLTSEVDEAQMLGVDSHSQCAGVVREPDECVRRVAQSQLADGSRAALQHVPQQDCVVRAVLIQTDGQQAWVRGIPRHSIALTSVFWN